MLHSVQRVEIIHILSCKTSQCGVLHIATILTYPINRNVILMMMYSAMIFTYVHVLYVTSQTKRFILTDVVFDMGKTFIKRKQNSHIGRGEGTH